MGSLTDVEIRIETVRTGTPIETAKVLERLALTSQRLCGTEEFVARLLVPPEHATVQWWESRYALNKCTQGISAPVFASLSHTAGASIAATCVATTDLIGIGVDIERSDRIISARAASRIQKLVPNSEEPEILRWIRYESAFKATYGNGDLQSMSSNRFETAESAIQTELHTMDEFVVAVAIARRLDSNS